MTPEAFRAARKNLGLSIVGLSIALGVGDHAGPNERTIRRWEKGEWPIPGPVVLAVRYLEKSSKKITKSP
jgi:DNA-binding transcriptional regulator YiaG